MPKRNLYSFYRIASTTYCYSSSTADNKKTSIVCFQPTKGNSFYTKIFDYLLIHSIPIGRCSRPIHLTRPKPLRFQIIYLMHLYFKAPFYYYKKNVCVYICLHKSPIIPRILNETTERNILLHIVKTVWQKVQAI